MTFSDNKCKNVGRSKCYLEVSFCRYGGTIPVDGGDHSIVLIFEESIAETLYRASEAEPGS